MNKDFIFSLEKIGMNELNLLNNLSGLKSKRLYHYTTLPGLMGMLDKGDFWLSNSLFLNDDEEIKNGKGIIRNVLKIKDDETERLDAVSQTAWNYYIFCLCENEEILSQWCKYSKNGTGACIEFSFYEQPEFFAGTEENHFVLGDVIYDDREKKKKIEKVKTKVLQALKIIEDELKNMKGADADKVKALMISLGAVVASMPLLAVPIIGGALFPVAGKIGATLWNMYEENKKKLNQQEVEELVRLIRPLIEGNPLNFDSIFSQCAEPLLPLFKSDYFKEERECRLIYKTIHKLDTVPVNFRMTANETIAPYIRFSDIVLKNKKKKEMPADYKLPIKRILLGPCEHRDWVKQSIEFLLKTRGYECGVELSQIPYRG